MQRLGSTYILDERIGSGAQGEVWKGHADGSEETLAFKILRSDLTRERPVIDAFLKERDTLERVDSPHVVRVRDIVVEGASLGLVMDYIGGGDLADVIRDQGPLPPARVAAFGADIAAGLSAVHAAGMVHRDVKPANILMDDSSTPPAPRVADFGVARICDDAGTTHSTTGVGTPLYMAPEVAEGMSAAPAMDIYSLGVVLYELACGVPPFVGNPIAVIKSHSTLVPGRPEGIPDPLWQLLDSMLSKDPARRPDAEQARAWLAGMVGSLEQLPAAPRLKTPPPATPVAAKPVEPDPVPPVPVPPSPGTPPVIQPGPGPLPPVPVPPSSGTPSSGQTVPGVGGAAPVPHPGTPAMDRNVGVVPVPKKKKRRKGRVLVAVLLVLVLLAAGGVAALKYLKPDKAAPVEAVATDTPVAEPPTPEAEPSETSTPSASPSSSTTASATRPSTMPDLVGKTQEEAKQALPGVTVDIAETAAQNGQKLGTVISTDPKAGESLPSTGSVTLTVASNTTTIYLADLKPISGGLDTGPVDLDGKAYAHGLSQTAYNSSDHGEEVVWNLGRYFTTLNGTIGLSDRSEAADATFTIDFWVDQKKIDTKEIRFGEFQKDFSLDVSNGLRLGIVVTRTDKHSGKATVAFGDFSLQADPSKTVPDISELNKQDH